MTGKTVHTNKKGMWKRSERWKCECVSCSVWTILCDPIDCSPPGSSAHGFSRQEYWNGLPFLPPGDLPYPEIEPRYPALQADSLPSEPPGKPTLIACFKDFFCPTFLHWNSQYHWHTHTHMHPHTSLLHQQTKNFQVRNLKKREIVEFLEFFGTSRIITF